ncbi:cytosine/adenosine deaminase-related metal-dependent hydrolase [Sporohalobacter salinus]|nr:amidohydrolase family protein [Sporohalobacter salinus]MBM7624832.1 cytosine/adenosine deaminase-related metal-dependent hydrolase [Sporohalobacter salinus]
MILTAQWVLPIEEEPISNGAIVIKEDYIEAVGKQDEIIDSYPEQKVKDLGSAIILPGLINIHTHLDYTVLRGENDDLSFLPWISNLVQKSRALTEREVLLSAKLGALELLASGVTAIGDATATGVSLQAAVDSGLRGVIYQEVFGMNDKKIDETLSALQEKVVKLKAESNSKLRIGLSPHASYSVSGRLLQEVSALAEVEELPLSMHLAETQEEVSFLKQGKGPFADTYRQAVGWGDIPWQHPGLSPVRYLADLDILTENLLVVHLVQTEKEEFDLLCQSNVKIAHCPKS